MQILIEDTDRLISRFMYIYYLAINVTTSPLYDLKYALINSTGDDAGSGGNFTRGDILNVSALWNASGVNSSYVWLNASGTVNEFNINHTDSNQNWTNHTFEFDNYTLFPTAGNVSVRMKAFDSFFQQNYTREMRYFYLWSNASIGNISVNESIYSDNTTIANGTTFAMTCLVSDYYSSQGVPGYNVSFLVDGAFIGTALTNSTGWASYTYTDSSGSGTSYDVRCNITDDSGVYYYEGPYNSSNETVHVLADGDRPYFIENWFEYHGTRINETGYYRNASIVLNVTDDTSYVSSAVAEVTFCCPTNVNQTMTQGQDGLWRFEFDGSGPWKTLNQSVSVRFYYWDAGGNLNSTNPASTNTLGINNTMIINLSDWDGNGTLYNRGENLSFSAYDVNGFIYDDANWSFNITEYGASANESSACANSTYCNVTINASEPVGNWTAWINASQMGNNGSSSFEFNVTNVLLPYFGGDIYEGRQYGKSADVNSVTPVNVMVNYSRGKNTAYNMSVNLTYKNVNYTLSSSGPVHSNSTMVLTTPGSASTSFTFYVDAADDSNNSGNTSVTMKTEADTVNIPSTGGTTGSSSFSSSLLCNCTEWVDVDCGSGNCTDAEMYQERVCTPAGCQAESRCIAMATCSDVKNFNVTAASAVVEVEQGKNATAILEVENTGNKAFELEILLVTECCEFHPGFVNFELDEKSQVTLPIIVHAPLSQEPDEYTLTVKFKEKDFEKTKGIKILVTENGLIREIDDMEALKNDIENEISVIEGLGIDATGLKRKVGELDENIRLAKESITGDNVLALTSYSGEARSVLDSINEAIYPVRIQAFLYGDWYKLLGSIVLLILIVYIIMEVIRPPLTLERRISATRKKLEEAKKVRSDTMKQYFKRSIDEKTRDRIIADKKEESNTLEVKLKELERERDIPMGSKASPVAILRWMASGPRKLVRRKPKAAGPAPRKTGKKPDGKKPKKEKSSGKMAEFQRKYLEAKKKQEEIDRR